MLGLGLGLTNFGTRGGVSDVPDALSGASSMLDGEDGLAIDFSDQSIAIRDTTTPANNIASAGTVRNSALVGPGAKITYTSPSPKLCRKSDGTYGYRAHNIFMSSEDFDHANWVKTGVTSSGNILAASSGGTNHRITQNLSVTAPHRVVFEVKAGTHPYVQIYDGASVQNYATFNLATGVVGASGTNTTAQITSLSAGVYRCEVVWGTSASVNGNTFFALAANGSAAWGSTFTAAGTETVTLYKAHYHNHLAIPDYIKTTSTPLYDLPYDWTGTYYYPLCEPAATNLGTFSRTWPVHANYSSTNITLTQVTGFDGEANSTYAFEATGANAWVNCHSLDNNVLDTTYTRSLFVKRLTGSGPVYIAPNGLYGWKGSGSETVTGSNKITNGDFPSNVTGWTITGTPDASNYFTWNAGGYADFASNGGIMVTQGTSGLTPGKVYRYAVTVTIASGVLRFSNGSNGLHISTSGTYYILVMASGTTDSGPAFSRVSGNLVCTIDDVVVREVTGIDLDVSGQLVTGEWRRVSVPPYVAHGGASARRILIATSGDKIAVDQHQIETGIVATSPIITAGATVTRAADNLSIATSAFPSLGSAGTLYVKGATRTGTTGNLYAVQLYTNGNNFAAIRNDSGIGAQGVVFNGGSQVAAPAVFNWAAGATKKVAIRLSTDNTNICSGGTLGTNDTSCAMPSYTTLFIGSNNGNNNFNGHIHEIMAKPPAASDAELQAMTT